MREESWVRSRSSRCLSSPQQASEGFQTEREFEERGAFRECALWRVEQGVEFVGADGVVREDEG